MRKALGSIQTIIILLVLLFSCKSHRSLTDEHVSKIIEKLQKYDSINKATPGDRNLFDDSARVYLAGEDLDFLTISQLEKIASTGYLYKSDAVREAFFPAMQRISSKKNIEGACASAIMTTNFPGYYTADDREKFMDDWAAVYRNFAQHPSIGEFILGNSKYNSEIFSRLQFLDPAAVGRSGLMNDIIGVLKEPMSQNVAKSSIAAFDMALNPETGMAPEIVEEIRILVHKNTSDALDSLLTHPGKNRNSIQLEDNLKNILKYLEGPTARQELIGYPAPDIGFTWCSNEKFRSLSELRGNVVIIDFWATWCSPCIGSFPNIRELQKRYRDYNVIILGVTSPQGYHVDRLNNKRIMLKGEPEKEISYMPGFMKDMNMTWEVAFSDISVFNPYFGVRGIPHVAIIDHEGNVRYNALRPYEAPFHEAEKIDQLLQEAGLPYPSEPMEKTNFSDQH